MNKEKKFLFSSQVNYNNFEDKNIKNFKKFEEEVNDLRVNIDIPNLKAVMQKKLFFNLKESKEYQKFDDKKFVGLVVTDPDEADPVQQKLFHLKKIKKQLKKMNLLKNRSRFYMKRVKEKSFSNICFTKLKTKNIPEGLET